MDPLQAFLQANALAPLGFAPDSRYHGLPTAQATLPGGGRVVFVTRRFLPQTDGFAVLQIHGVVAGDRLDNLATAYLGDAGQWWRLCDANGAMLPEGLVAKPGARLAITLPEGVRGMGDAG